MSMTELTKWSVSALAAELSADRRTVAAAIRKAGVPPAGEGPKGPLFHLRPVAAALLTSTCWSCIESRTHGAQDMAAALLKRLPKRRPRVMVETLVAALFESIAAGEAEAFDLEPSEPPDWRRMSRAQLEAALRKLLKDGYLPSEEPPDGE
jgi:hypothetical protein